MPINERGEFIRIASEGQEKEKDPIAELSALKDAFFAQSVAPSDKPDDLLYWKGERLNHYRELFEKMKQYAQANGLTEFTDPHTQELVNLESFFDKIKRSIEYSEQTNDKKTTYQDDAKKKILDRLLDN